MSLVKEVARSACCAVVAYNIGEQTANWLSRYVAPEPPARFSKAATIREGFIAGMGGTAAVCAVAILVYIANSCDENECSEKHQITLWDIFTAAQMGTIGAGLKTKELWAQQQRR